MSTDILCIYLFSPLFLRKNEKYPRWVSKHNEFKLVIKKQLSMQEIPTGNYAVNEVWPIWILQMENNAIWSHLLDSLFKSLFSIWVSNLYESFGECGNIWDMHLPQAFSTNKILPAG